MIISHKYKFIFIKTYKTAGTSIEVFLSQYCDDGDVFTPINPHIENHVPMNYKGFFNPFPELIEKKTRKFKRTFKEFIKRRKFYGHIPAIRVKHRIHKNIWGNYFKFCIERNPWDKTLSHYHMMKYRRCGKLHFDEYLMKGKFCLNYPKYTDSEGNRIIVDHVIKYENLNQELNEIFSQLGVPFSGSLNIRAKSEYRTDRRHYREIYAKAQKHIIERAFQKEIMMHDYRF